MAEILSPTPTRHLIDGSASHRWLHTPPLSPLSSRAPTPVSTVPTSPSISMRKLALVGKNPKPEGTEPTFARRWIRYLHRQNMKSLVLPSSILGATLIKFCTGLGSYSGMGTPPMYGDYEAQRHWMEITIHLPIRQWYTHDLQYWGLDYPPLTAYVSWICGQVGTLIDPSWFALQTSRGYESVGSKLYMRSSVLILDALIYVPSLIMFCRTWQGTRSKRTQSLALLVLLLQPALLLIDFGHFQYNSIMLALTLFSVNSFASNRDFLGAICFVLSLGFKQMALYYAPAIGAYLLAKCIYLGPTFGSLHLIRLGCVTILSFLLLFLPWIPLSASATLPIMDPITRIFPFARGLFEDKVANFWCFTNVLLIKWKTVSWASPSLLMRFSTLLTALGFLPSVAIMLRTAFRLSQARSTHDDVTASASTTPDNRATPPPFLPLLPYTLLSSSMSFFLFSFQVHEKTILLPLFPITLLFSGANVDSSLFAWGVLANNAAVFSMWPLLKKDGLGLQYIALLVLWNRLIGYNLFKLPNKSLVQLISLAFYCAAFGLHFLELVVKPPSRYPDLFPVLNVLVSTPIFGSVWLWSIKCCVEVSWAVGGLAADTVSKRAGSHPPSVVTLNKIKFPADLDSPNSLGLSNHTTRQVGLDRSSGARAVSLGGLSHRSRPLSSSGLSSVSNSSVRSRRSSVGETIVERKES